MLFIKDCLYRLKGSQRVMILGQLNKHKYHKTYGYSIVLCLPVRRGAPGHLVLEIAEIRCNRGHTSDIQAYGSDLYWQGARHKGRRQQRRSQADDVD
jgi:hypothetical protein